MDTIHYAFTIAVATVVLLFYFAYTIFFKKVDEPEVQETKLKAEKPTEKNSKSNTKTEKKSAFKPTKAKDVQLKHKWLAATLKAHSDKVTGIDFSSNGKYLLSCGLDRAIFLWYTKDFQTNQPKNVRCNVEYDHATQVKFSPDCKSFIIGLGVGNTIRAFKISKKEDGSNLQMLPANLPDFPQVHKADIINIGLSCNAKFIMTCGRDTNINIWDLKGEVLGSIDTKMMNNSFAAVSPCGRFFGACGKDKISFGSSGFTPEARIWEVCFDKSGNFSQIKSAFQVSHSAGVYNFSFNTDASKMASVSKDKTWKLWNTKIDYERGQEAELLLTGNVREEGPSLIALSPDSYTVAVSSNKTLSFFSTITAKCEEFIENVCTDSISEMSFSSCSNYLALACDKHVRIFNNITGHKVAIESLKKELIAAKTEGAKQRIEQIIDGHYDFIKKVED